MKAEIIYLRDNNRTKKKLRKFSSKRAVAREYNISIGRNLIEPLFSRILASKGLQRITYEDYYWEDTKKSNQDIKKAKQIKKAKIRPSGIINEKLFKFVQSFSEAKDWIKEKILQLKNTVADKTNYDYFVAETDNNKILFFSAFSNIDEIIDFTVNNDAKIYFRITYIVNGEEKYYSGVLNNLQKKFLIKLGTIKQTNNLTPSSDELIFYYKTYIKSFEFDYVKPPERFRKKIIGEFFEYYNTTPIDLSRAGIYKEEEKDKILKIKDHCFILAMIASGNFDERTINRMRLFLQNRDLPKKKIKDFCKEFDILVFVKNLDTKSHNNITKYGDPSSTIKIELGLLKDHYFLIFDLPFTYFYAKNYEKLIDNYEDPENIMQFNKDRKGRIYPGYCKKNQHRVNTFKVIKLLDKLGKFKKIEQSILNSVVYKKEKKKEMVFDDLSYNEQKDCRKMEYKPKIAGDCFNKGKNKDKNYYFIVFADFETYVGTDKNFKEYLISWSFENSDKIFSEYGENCAVKFLEAIPSRSYIYFHNLGFDFTFLINYLDDIQMIKKGNRILSADAVYITKNGIKRRYKFLDSLSIIPYKLSKFSELFGSEFVQEKEIMPYDYFNNFAIEGPSHTIEEVSNYVKKEDKDEFIDNCKKMMKNNNGMFDKIKYAVYYCERDVKILKNGYMQFRKQIKEITGLDPLNYVSISSIAFNYALKEGCFDDVYELSNIPQMFIQKTILGGRVMSRENKKYCVENQIINDFDAVSLYPSAMVLFPTVPTGKPLIINDKQKKIIEETGKLDGNAFYVQIKVNEVNKKRSFPLLYERTKEGIINYTNDIPAENLFVDNYYLQDLVKMHDIKFNVINGYYFIGYNNKISKIQKQLGEKRNELKALDNPMQNIYKLMMNSVYGRSILKPITSEIKLIKKDKVDQFVLNYYHTIMYIEPGDKYSVIKVKKPINKHYNACHVGSKILSASKKIMNEIFYIADQVGAKIYYQDTDSMHVSEKDVKKIEKEYKKQNNKELIGKEFGQFHNDFILHKQKGPNIYSDLLIILGKKCYLDRLKNKENPEEFDYHLRMKGISVEALDDYGDPVELYKKLYNGKQIEFDLSKTKKIFKFERNFKVHYDEDFKRKLKF